MSERHGLCHGQPHAQDGLQAAAARQDLQAQQGVHGDARSVGQPAQEEAENQNDGGPDCPSLLPLSPQGALGQPEDDDPITNQQHQTWDHQTDQDQLQVENRNPEGSVLLWVETLAERGPFTSFLGPGKHQVRHRQEARRQPGTCRQRQTLNTQSKREIYACGWATLTCVNQPVCQQLPQPAGVRVRGPDHRQVTVQADEGQDEHAAVQIDRVDDVDANAGGRPEAPVGHGRVHGPERQRQDKEEIGGGQVEAVPVCEAAL